MFASLSLIFTVGKIRIRKKIMKRKSLESSNMANFNTFCYRYSIKEGRIKFFQYSWRARLSFLSKNTGKYEFGIVSSSSSLPLVLRPFPVCLALGFPCFVLLPSPLSALRHATNEACGSCWSTKKKTMKDIFTFTESSWWKEKHEIGINPKIYNLFDIMVPKQGAFHFPSFFFSLWSFSVMEGHFFVAGWRGMRMEHNGGHKEREVTSTQPFWCKIWGILFQ